MPIIQVPFPKVDVVYEDSCSHTYKRVGFLTMSDISPTFRLDVVFTPADDDVFEDLCVGVVIASPDVYGRYSELDVQYADPFKSSKGNWVRQGLRGVDEMAYYIYKFYGNGIQRRELRNFTLTIQGERTDWVLFAGIHKRTDVEYVTTQARGTLQVIQCLSIRHDRILSASTDKFVYREEDKDDKRGRKEKRAKYEVQAAGRREKMESILYT